MAASFEGLSVDHAVPAQVHQCYAILLPLPYELLHRTDPPKADMQVILGLRDRGAPGPDTCMIEHGGPPVTTRTELS